MESHDNKNFSHSTSFRIPFCQREKAAYLILRRKGLSYNTIAECFGRSTSVVYRSVKRATKYEHKIEGYWNARRKYGFDLRKLPYATRMRITAWRRALMVKLREAWTAWVTGEGERPP